ncbi:MAG: hypothetical protein QOF06_1508 [Solirubrobacterales bacterium]|jgi:hypothetical protein|nr:hypothetical protein [Solirubrobacterales bacterium]
MVERFSSDRLELPPANRPFERADLIFYGIDHSGPSFEARVFMDQRGVSHGADSTHRAYVGAFFIFGHNGCFGDVGHCDIPSERDPFDLRSAHQLEPALRVLTVTDAVRDLLERELDAVKVTVTAHTEDKTSNDVLAFDTVRLTTYA